jgi:putative FmdB family regulatory protein
MPTYEYVCEKCGHQFEKSQPMTAAALTTCPKEVCPKKPWKKGKVKRGISGGAGLIFKGTGFYITDYRSDKYKEAAKKDVAPSATPAPAAGGSSGDTTSKSATPAKAAPAAKSESKPAAKSGSKT